VNRYACLQLGSKNLAARWLAMTIPTLSELILLSLHGLGEKRDPLLAKARAGASLDDIVELLQASTLRLALKKRLDYLRLEGCERMLELHAKGDFEFLVPGAENYPPPLAAIPGPAPLLFARGRLDLLRLESVAVVGTRRADASGLRMAQKMAGALSSCGFLVVSGAAEGIDVAAHRGAGFAQTCAVLGSGFDHPFPSHHRDLIEQIGQEGLLLSEHPPWVKPRRFYFPRRNRVVAALCLATLVVQAPFKSGARITACEAIDMGRELYVCPGPVEDTNWDGSHELIRMGARLVSTPKHLIDDLGTLPLGPLSELVKKTTTTCDLQVDPLDLHASREHLRGACAFGSKKMSGQKSSKQIVLEALGQPAFLEDLLLHLRLDLSEISGLLLELELEGLVSQGSDESWRRTW
jgi:DNA processing protein